MEVTFYPVAFITGIVLPTLKLLLPKSDVGKVCDISATIILSYLSLERALNNFKLFILDILWTDSLLN